MSGKDLYEENKRLKAEISRMQEAARYEHEIKQERREADIEFALDCVMAFFRGTGRLTCSPSAGGAGKFSVRFEL